MKKKGNIFFKGITAILFAAVMMLSVFAMAVPSVASLGSPGVDTDIAVIPDSTSEAVLYTTDGALGSILVITYNWGYPNATHVEDALVEAGYTVTALYNPSAGVISSNLTTDGYDQVWLWDITTSLNLTDGGDKAALVNWYGVHRGNIIIDARSYGAYYDYNDDKLFIENEAYAFSLRGGGLWIGCDHDPGWTKNANALLTAMGYATVTGIYYAGVAGGDTTCKLLTTPNSIPDPTILYAFSTVGSAPTGVQPDGVDLKSLLWNENDTVYTSYALSPAKKLDPVEGGLGTVVNVTINVTVGENQTVKVVDTLPEEFTYINGTFYVDGVEVIPTVTTTPPPPPRSQVISYTINNSGSSTNFSKIEFDVKVTKAYWEDRKVCNEVAVYNETDYEIGNATAEFTVYAFTDLYKYIIKGPTEPEIGVLAEWKIGMGVTNNFSYIMNNTKITDRFGGDLKIDSINTTAGNYTFNYTDYAKKKATVTIKNESGDIIVNVSDLNRTGITIGAEPYEFHIFWTGKAHKAHFEWTIGDLASGNSTGITINVSTDTNPGTGHGKCPKGHQEYTSPGNHTLNSGATLKFMDSEDMQHSAVTDSIVVTVPEED